MIPVPGIFKKTRSVKRIGAYMDETFNEVLHTTLNPNGPGVIRLHLIPPKKEESALNPSVVIVNGTDIVPVNFAWAVMLAEMIRERGGDALVGGDIADGVRLAAERAGKDGAVCCIGSLYLAGAAREIVLGKKY